MSFLDELVEKPSRLVAGAMSGTSMDSIDVAICNIVGAGLGASVELKTFGQIDYPADVTRTLRKGADLTVQDIAELNVSVGHAFGRAIAEVAVGMRLELAGSHGQTIYHHSRREGAALATLQVGDGDVIAEILRVPVVSDFRTRDIAAGGEGAPLTPYADFVLFAGNPHLAVLNLGGIANITLLGEKLSDVRGFDTGPANGPLDLIAKQEFGLPYDSGGQISKTGVFDSSVLDDLLDEDSFVNSPAPKSTGLETYGAPFVAMLRERSGSSGANLLRLATEFVVESIGRQVSRSVHTLTVAGGGVNNAFLMERLSERLGWRKVEPSDARGVPHQAREAMAFAILANDAICGLPTSLPSVTGARHSRTLGKLSWPPPTFG